MVLNYACLCDSSAALISVRFPPTQLHFLQAMSSNTAASQQNHPWQQRTAAQGSGKKDAEGRFGPWVPQHLLSTIPAGMVYRSENGKHAQLVQPCDPKRPYISELFQNQDKEVMVKYPGTWMSLRLPVVPVELTFFSAEFLGSQDVANAEFLGGLRIMLFLFTCFLFLIFMCFELKYYC